MKKRLMIGLLSAGLLAAMLPGVVAAQAAEAEGTTTFATNFTCELGQGSPLDLPACEVDETAMHFTVLNPARKTGTFDGVQVLDATVDMNPADGSFTYSGLVLFVGTVEGCGTGTVYFEVEGEGMPNETGPSTWTSNTHTAVPGGTLPLTGTLDESGTEVVNDDGTVTWSYTGTYACDAE